MPNAPAAAPTSAEPPPVTGEPDRAGSATLELLLRPDARDLIDRAAGAAGKTRGEFVLDAARREAEWVLRERRLITLPPEDYDALAAAIEGPPKENPRLRKLLETPDPWDRGEAG